MRNMNGENCAIVPHTRQFGYKKRNLLEVKLGERGLQNNLLTAVAAVAA
jgi:hypothetical protein